jgi:hypothetical protein
VDAEGGGGGRGQKKTDQTDQSAFANDDDSKVQHWRVALASDKQSITPLAAAAAAAKKTATQTQHKTCLDSDPLAVVIQRAHLVRDLLRLT